MITGVSSLPPMTNLRGRTLAATRTPLTATGNAPGSMPASAADRCEVGANGFVRGGRRHPHGSVAHQPTSDCFRPVPACQEAVSP